jgi:DNA-binding NtrC family response regulator
VRAGATLADLTTEIQREAASVALGVHGNSAERAARALAISPKELERLVETPTAVKELA